MNNIDLQGQTIYADLIASCALPVFDGHSLSFTKKTVKNKQYWYLNLKIGKTAIQKYLGPDDNETNQLIAKEKSFWAKSNPSEKQYRARLVDMFLAAGGISLSQNEAKILTILQRAGVFLSGAVLVGTPAFRALGNNLGVVWIDDYRTKDLDLALDHRFPVAINNKAINIRELLLEKKIGAIEIPALNRKNPSTSYKIRNQDYIIDLLTPEIGKPNTKPLFISQFNTYATPLRYLDYLLEDIEPAVLPFGVGILINVPNPARFALHKLVISQRRTGNQAIKSQKDIRQASQILEQLFETRPGSVLVALDAAEKMGSKFIKQLQVAVKLLPENIQQKWNEWGNL